MINSKTANTFRQHHSVSPKCHENCDFCPGLGLTEITTPSPSSHLILSCNYWSESAINPKLEMEHLPDSFFIPTTYLRGLRVFDILKKIPKGKRVILLLDSLFFDSKIIQKIQADYDTEIWIVLKIKQNIIELIQKVLELKNDKLYFYSPQYNGNNPLFFTTSELHLIIKKIKTHFPKLSIRHPEGIDIYNSTLNTYDLNFHHETIFNKTINSIPEVSVIIPCFENSSYVIRVLQSLKEQQSSFSQYEVILVDDGSSKASLESLKTFIQQADLPYSIKAIHYMREENRSMGDLNFRAGLARTLGVSYSRGKILSFLDSDIIVPPQFISSLMENHKEYDVVQIQRVYLNKEATDKIENYGQINPYSDIFHPDGGYWKRFFEDKRPWQEIPSFWKYTCTYGLSVRANKFQEVNGFRSIFNSYGFEDTDLGYRLFKAKASFHKSSIIAYHLWHPPLRSEFKNSDALRAQLLQKTGRMFFRHTLDPKVFDEMKGIFKEKRPLSERISNYLNA